MQPCSIRLSDRQLIMNLLPSFSSNGRTVVLSPEECSARGLLSTCGGGGEGEGRVRRAGLYFNEVETRTKPNMVQAMLGEREKDNTRNNNQKSNVRTHLLHSRECRGPGRTDLTSPPSWQSESLHPSQRYTVTERESGLRNEARNSSINCYCKAFELFGRYGPLCSIKWYHTVN